MEQDQSCKNELLQCNRILDDQSKKLRSEPPNPLRRKHEDVDASASDARGYELRENPKKSWRISRIHRNVDDASAHQERTHKCHICGREFDLASSLNGHLRHHSAKENKKVRCQICRSKFNSVRGLNGHMRIHSAKNVVVDSHSAPSNSEPGNPLKKKRSKRSRYHLSMLDASIDEFEFSEVEEEVAEILLSLSAVVDTKTFSDFASGEPFLLDSDEKPAGEMKPIAPEIADECLLPTCKQKESKESDLKFKCKICNRGFASYQKLGGHQTSHRLSKGSSNIKSESSSPELEINIPEAEDSHTSMDLDCVECLMKDGTCENKEFKCRICSKRFATGQALGGHKRAHWEKSREEMEQQISDAGNILDVKVSCLFSGEVAKNIDSNPLWAANMKDLLV